MTWWKFWKATSEKPDFVSEFLRNNEQSPVGARSLDQLTFTVLDTETTGLRPEQDSIVSFGAVKISGLKIQIQEAVEWYPESQANGREAIPVHGIVAIPDPISIERFAKQLLPYLGNSILVGHHLGFDLEMLSRLLRPYGITQFPNPILDTLSLAIRLEHGPNADRANIQMEEYSLDALCTRYGIETEDRHTAAGDAFLTARLFLKLIKIAQRKGIKTYKDLMK